MRLSYDDLNALHDRLFERLVDGRLDVATYLDEWDALVEFAGWTWEQVSAEVDRRWSTRNKSAQAFLC
jgi:hypothetical protein